MTTRYEDIANSIEGHINALLIISKYEPNGIGQKFFLEAEHEVIYSHVGREALAEDSNDGKSLIELGWEVDPDTGLWAYYT